MKLRRWLRLALAWTPKQRTHVRRSEAAKGKRRAKVVPIRKDAA